MLQIWFASVVLTVISWPVVKHWALAKIVGVLAVAYLAFVLATLRLVPLPWGIFLSLGIWIIINVWSWRKNKVTWPGWREIMETELVFGALFLFFIWVKGHNPTIYEIEKLMDFGFIRTLFNTSYLPMEDVWMAGKSLNYYYFGHFIGFTLLKLSALSPEAGFFLLQCWIFAVIGTLAHRFGGWVSLFCVVFAGGWHTLTALNDFWYPAPTRLIPGTITEMPIYAFLISDLHAHVWGLLLGTAALVAFFSDRKYLLTLLLGLAIMTNSWDFLIIGSLLIIARKRYALLALPVAIILALPWLVFFRSPVSGFSWVTSQSPIGPWLLFWSAPLAIFIFYPLISKLERKKFQPVLIGVAVWLLLLELIYAKDVLSGGEWFRANTYFKVSLQVWLWLGMIAGPIINLLLKRKITIFYFLVAIWLVSRAIYPVKAINQAALEGKSYTGLATGLDFWKNKFPADFAAYEFLKTQPPGVILEADGDSYSDTSRMSVFLGWPTVSGWAVHEWTWRGSYDEIGRRAGQVRAVYEGTDFSAVGQYNVKYIVVGQVERRKYANINLPALERLGKIIFKSGETEVVRVY